MISRFKTKGWSAGGTTGWPIYAVLALFLALISWGVVYVGLPFGVVVSLLPLCLIVFLAVIQVPYRGLMLLLVVNYFVNMLIRYTRTDGLSVFIDILILFTFLAVFFNQVAKSGRVNTLRINGVLIAALLWAVYCTFELLNPTALTDIWIRSRGMAFYFLLIVLLTMLTFQTFRNVKTMLYILSVLTLIGAGHGVVQQVFGFNAVEVRSLNEQMAITHLLPTGIRYFSIFASSGIFGAVMGHASLLFLIAAIYIKGWTRFYFLFVAGAALYGLMISGTRGAMAIPGAGLLLFIILSRRIRLMIPTLVVCVAVYLFLAMTTLGQGNQYIRRLRTILDPNEPSLVVRKNNQKLFAEYLKDKPFGEGLGLSGVDARIHSERFTTSIPTDSWYVKIWVETGIVGLCLHIAIFLYVLIYGSYLILFRIRNDTLRGVLAAIHCGTFGILVASYGNQILGQFPVVVIFYMSIGLVFIGPLLDRRINNPELEALQS